LGRCAQKSVLALGVLISCGFRKKRQQADSCDVSLTSTPTTTISATVGGAFISPSNSSVQSLPRATIFHSSEPCFARQRACDSSARRLRTAASVNGRRTVVRPFANSALRKRRDDNRTALCAPPTALFTDLRMSVSLPTFIQ